jgi:hypothetical protein
VEQVEHLQVEQALQAEQVLQLAVVAEDLLLELQLLVA